MSKPLRSLPFRLHPEASPIEIVGTSPIGEIEIPRFGSLLVGESLAYERGLADLEQPVGDVADKHLKVTILIRSRLDPDWDTADTEGLSSALLDALADFWLHEQARWEPFGFEAAVQSKGDGLAIATAYAQEHGLCVCTRKDLAKQGIYYVFRRVLVPHGGFPAWETVADFGGARERSEEPQEGDGEPGESIGSPPSGS